MKGLEANLDVSKYTNPEFDYYQMKELMLGLQLKEALYPPEIETWRTKIYKFIKKIFTNF